jgi:hypothetical protein
VAASTCRPSMIGETASWSGFPQFAVRFSYRTQTIPDRQLESDDRRPQRSATGSSKSAVLPPLPGKVQHIEMKQSFLVGRRFRHSDMVPAQDDRLVWGEPMIVMDDEGAST